MKPEALRKVPFHLVKGSSSKIFFQQHTNPIMLTHQSCLAPLSGRFQLDLKALNWFLSLFSMFSCCAQSAVRNPQ